MKNQSNNKNISPLSYEEVKLEIKAMLPTPTEFDDDHNLIELGLDSLRIMRMVNKWRRRGATVTFAELIAAPRLSDWWSLLQKNNTADSAVKECVKVLERDEDAKGPFPLTDVQYAYWIGRRDDQPLGAIGCHAYLEIDGEDVEPECLETAWGQLLTHHSMLRARFLDNGQQEVLTAPFSKAVLTHDLRHCPEGKLVLELEHIRDRLSHRRLAVEQGEVAGLELSLLPGGRTRIHFDIDLLVADVQSLHIVLRDLAAAYARGCQPAAPVNWSFAEYLKQEAQRRISDQQTAGQYWHQRLSTLPVAPGLPLKEKPESITSPVFKRRNYFLKRDDWTLLQKRSAAYQVTPAMVLLTAYAEVLDRWSTNSRFLINMPLFDRQTGEAGLEDVIADFTNLLLLSVDCSSRQSFLDRVRSVQTQFYKDVAHAAYSGVQVQRDLARARQGERNFAPVVFACNLGTPFINAECRETLGKLSYMISQTPQVWLDFQTYEMDDGLLLAWDAVDQLFPDGLIEQMFAAYTQMLDWLVSDNNDWQSLADVLPLSQRQRRDREVKLPMPQSSQCLHTSFFDFAAVNPQENALIDSSSNRYFSYGELSQYALRVAAFLKNAGVQEGDPVAVTLPRGIGQIAAVFGILAIGACYVPVSIEQPSVRRDCIHKKAVIRYVLTDHERAQTLEWPGGTTILNITAAADTPPLTAPVTTSPERLAYIIFTSGSTGEPKGVEISHYGAWNTISDINRRYKVGPADRVLSVSSLDFDLSVYDIFGLLSVGGSLVLITDDTRRDATYWLEMLNKYQVNIWNSVPVLLDMLLVAAESERQKNLPLRLAMLSGDWIGLDLPSRLKSAAEHCQLVAMGGATEASIWSNFLDVTVPVPPQWTSIPYGRPLANQTYRVVDEKGRDCPDWVAGELWIGGAGVAQGYRGDPELTVERFINWNGFSWYRTGDLGRYWPDDNIEFLGRKDFQVKIRGHRIELGEIEAALKQHPGVRDAAVAAAGELQGNKYLVGYVVTKQEGESTHFAIESADPDKTNAFWAAFVEKLPVFLSQKLPEYMIPSVFISLSKLPLTANGKVDRQALPTLANVKQVKPEKVFSAPRTPTEVALTAIWRQILGIEQIDVTDSFFELGGDSLLATRLSAMVRTELEVELSLGKIFESPTIAKLAEHIQILKGEKTEKSDTIACLPQIVPAPDQWHLPFPLTDIQHAYLIGRSGVYTLGNVATHCYFEIEGIDLDLGRLNRAWQRLIDHHSMMRVVILADGKNQKILEQIPPYQIQILDLRGKGPEDVESGLKNIREEMSHQVLSADEWPLFDVRASLFGEKRVRLHISFDNLIFDGWSIFHLLCEWTHLYHEPDAQLSSLDLSFKDYVLALEQLKESDLYQRDREYWFIRLPDLPPAPELPLAQNPESISRQRFNRLAARLSCETWQALKKRSAEAGLTPSGVLLTAYAEIIGVWSKRPRFTINLTQYNRLPVHPQVNDIVGEFTSLTLLAVDNSRGKTFLERGRNLQQQLWRDLDHPYFGGVQVQRELAKRNGDHQGGAMPVVFSSALGVSRWSQNDPDKKWLGKLVYNITQTPQVWLDHQVVEQDGELLLNWDTVEGLFPEGLLDDMFAAYCHLLQRLANEETAWQETTPSLAAVPRLEKRIEANNTDAPVSADTLTSLFVKQAARQPEHPAVIASGRTLTYEELSCRAAAVGKLLWEKGARPNTLVAVVTEKGWEQVVAVLGVLKAGAAYLPIDPAHPEERRWQLLRDGNVKMVLTQSRLDERLGWPPDVERLLIDQITPGNKAVSPLDGAGKPEDLAYVIYTSGSTGFPKGVMIDHRGAVNTILDVNKRFSVRSEDRILAMSNLNFDLSVYDIFGILAAGATIIMPEADKTKDPSHWLALMRQEQVTVWNTVPALMQMLLEYAAGRNEVMPQSLRLVLLSGDWIPLELPDKIKAHFHDAQVIGLGGATEASIWSNLYPVQEIDPDWKSIPYGRPMVNQRYYVLNKFMRDCPVWVPGQLYIGGIGLAKGYWNDSTKTREKFIRHPHTGERLYCTGDLGRYLPDGNIEFLGREDFQVKIKGHRIELGEIETALKRHVGVKDAVVAVSGESREEKHLVGYVVLDHEKISDLFETEHSDPAVCTSRWQAIQSTCQVQARQIPDAVDIKAISVFMDYADHLSFKFICNTLYDMGIFAGEGEGYSIDELMRRFKIHPRYQTLILHWLNVLIEEGVLERNEAGIYLNRRSLHKELPDLLQAGKLNLFPNVSKEALALEAFFRCDNSLYIELLQGNIDPLELFLTEDSSLTPEALSQFNLSKEYYIDLSCKVFSIIVNSYPLAKELRVLEIGTRAGSATSSLVSLLPAGRGGYLYADESSFFTDRIRQKLGGRAPLEYGLFDMNKTPLQQGYEPHSFDVIIADNTLHRARNIETTLEYLKEILAPGGLLVFIESTRNRRLMLTTVGFFEDGFSHLEDDRKTNHLPLITAEKWCKILDEKGFSKVMVFPESGDSADVLGQHLIVAQAPETIRVFKPANLSAAMRRQLPDYMVPATYVLLDELPLSGNGKVDRKKLTEFGREKEYLPKRRHVAPCTDTQVKIANVWQEILGCENIGIHDGFFELGGDSLRAIQCINLLKERYQVDLSLPNLFQAPSIDLLAKIIEADVAATEELAESYDDGII
ncbi:Tyrocidine synthase 3 [Sporomusa ovata DSM 2662]|uniref:Phenyloxazoline synthase MbtB n=1 Tax=Sporomusa ovata TaxID=2378 RepID=A0A0U1L2J9_9FIRM|nr:non-ribosomal peptide synthetase [Sporomusa ovata]EQB25313.1 amino acid adenylation domain containing protein [Sporomusa ovata DSM 2662]CQR73880.1 iron aquisition yersiniabactin synthesis enzyme (Irp2) [Sporomusa ovata]